MPLVNIKVIEGVFNEEQKQEMIQKVTDTMVSIEGGKCMTAEDVIAFAKG
jgi:4-oxalocrotonate tautomerase family enzyme